MADFCGVVLSAKKAEHALPFLLVAERFSLNWGLGSFRPLHTPISQLMSCRFFANALFCLGRPSWFCLGTLYFVSTSGETRADVFDEFVFCVEVLGICTSGTRGFYTFGVLELVCGEHNAMARVFA